MEGGGFWLRICKSTTLKHSMHFDELLFWILESDLSPNPYLLQLQSRGRWRSWWAGVKTEALEVICKETVHGTCGFSFLLCEERARQGSISLLRAVLSVQICLQMSLGVLWV